MDRVLGRCGANINYRHMIWSLVKKPGSFARYKFREQMFPTLIFRRAYDALAAANEIERRADVSYLRILHLAAVAAVKVSGFNGLSKLAVCVNDGQKNRHD